MAVILDTAGLPENERAAAFDQALNTATMPVRTERASEPGEDVYARVQYWALGKGVEQIHTESSAFRFARTPRHVRRAAPEQVALAIHVRGDYTLGQGDQNWRNRAGELHLLDLTSPYEYATRGDAAAQGLHITYQRLGLPVDLVRRAAPRLTSSPLYDLVRAHFARLPLAATAVEGTAAAAMLGDATTELSRALIASAADDRRHIGRTMDESLLTRIDLYVQRHLAEPDLTPARIAAEHNISVRYLHRLFEGRRDTVSRTIMRLRLEAVRRDLAGPAGARDGVLATARRWGFTNASHFSRRFRETYGTTPQDWLRLNHDA